MKEIYFLFLVVVVAFGSSVIGYYLPTLKLVFKRYITRSNVKSPSVSLKEFNALKTRVETLENRMDKRHYNDREAMRQEITKILIKLKKQ